MSNTLYTKTLRNGLEALAKNDRKYGICAYTFSNRTQAENAATRTRLAHNVDTHIWQGTGRPFFVIVTARVS